MTEFAVVYLIVAALGACVGSFLNVCIVRMPAGESILWPPSKCPVCGAAIRPWDNIPLVSYCLLRGRCRRCKASISMRYPAVELLTAVVFVLLFWRFDLSVTWAVAALFAAALIVISGIDLQHRIIPDRITLPGIVCAWAVAVVTPWTTLPGALLGSVLGGGILYLFATGYALVTGRQGMGGGDIKLLAMIGGLLGWQGALLSLMLAAFAGSIVGTVIILCKGRDMKYAVPFGPFLSLGALVTIAFGDFLIASYLQLWVP